MIYYTGDIHGSTYELTRFCYKMTLSEEDIIVILGDVGANYYGGKRDCEFKEAVSLLKPTIFCIHGNHEKRPATIPSYKLKAWNGGMVWYEENYPNLLFAKDGEIFTLGGLQHMDGLLDFCDEDRFIDIYRQLCRHIYTTIFMWSISRWWKKKSVGQSGAKTLPWLVQSKNGLCRSA